MICTIRQVLLFVLCCFFFVDLPKLDIVRAPRFSRWYAWRAIAAIISSFKDGSQVIESVFLKFNCSRFSRYQLLASMTSSRTLNCYSRFTAFTVQFWSIRNFHQIYSKIKIVFTIRKKASFSGDEWWSLTILLNTKYQITQLKIFKILCKAFCIKFEINKIVYCNVQTWLWYLT